MMTNAERDVAYVRNAMAALRGRMPPEDVAARIGIKPVTLRAHACDPGTRGYRAIPARRLADLMTIAADEMRRAAGEMEAATRAVQKEAA